MERKGRLIVNFPKKDTLPVTSPLADREKIYEPRTFTESESKELISKNTGYILKILAKFSTQDLKDNALIKELGVTDIIGTTHPIVANMNDIGKKVREEFNLTSEVYGPGDSMLFASSASRIIPGRIDRNTASSRRFKFYCSIDPNAPSESVTKFLEELFTECAKNGIRLDGKTLDHQYDQPCLYTTEPEKLEIILKILYLKYPNIWLNAKRHFQEEIPGINPAHLAFVQEPYGTTYLPKDSHSGRMHTMGTFITKKILEGRIFNESLYTEAAIYSGVSPEEPFKLNPNYWRKVSKLSAKESNQIKGELYYKRSNAQKIMQENLTSLESLTKAELKKIIEELRNLLHDLFEAGYKGTEGIYEVEEFYKKVLKRYLQ